MVAVILSSSDRKSHSRLGGYILDNRKIRVGKTSLNTDSKVEKFRIFFLLSFQFCFFIVKYFSHILIFTCQILTVFVVVVTMTKPHVFYCIMIGKTEQTKMLIRIVPPECKELQIFHCFLYLTAGPYSEVMWYVCMVS